MKRLTLAGLLSLLFLLSISFVGVFRNESVNAQMETDAPLATQEICYTSSVPAGWVIVGSYMQNNRCGIVVNTYNIYNVYIIERISDYYVGTHVTMCNWAAHPTPDWVVVNTYTAYNQCSVTVPGPGAPDNIKIIRRVNGPTPTPTPTPTTPIPGSPPIGYLDSVTSSTRLAKGWSLDPDNPQTPNKVHLYINGPAGNTQGSGTFLVEVTADKYRPDVNSGTGYPGNHGFEYVISNQYCDGINHPIYAYGIDTGPNGSKILQNSPLILNCSPPVAGSPRTPFDYNGDHKADITVLRNGSDWYSLLTPGSTFSAVSFGQSGDIPLEGDFDGDGKSDIAVSRSQSGGRYFYIRKSSDGQFYGVQFGIPVDVPVIGDYDGDGKSDIAVWRPGGGSGTWYILNSSTNQMSSAQFGLSSDKPVPADYDGDGKTDIAVTRQSSGALNWYVQRSALGFIGYGFGLDSDKAVPADYDGDGKADIGVFRNGAWYIQRSALGFYGVGFGQSGDIPVQADYDGEGKADIAVFRGDNGSGYFYIINSATGQYGGGQFGLATDNPIGGNYPR